jgi:hypothetical protein
MAVEGIDGADYWQAWQIAEQMIGDIGDRSVDLIDMATESPSLKRAIERHGVVL